MKKQLLSFIFPCYRSENRSEGVVSELENTVKQRTEKYAKKAGETT